MDTNKINNLLNIDNYPGLFPKDIMGPYIDNFTKTFSEIPWDSYARKPLDTNIRLMNYYKTISDKNSMQIRYALQFCNDLKKSLTEYAKATYQMFDIQIELKGRIKSPTSTIVKFKNKINEYMKKGKDLDSLQVNDLFAFRTIITVKDKAGNILDDNTAIPVCYDITEQAVEFAKQYQYIQTMPSKPRSDKHAPIVHDNVTKPTSRPAYIVDNENIIKDYIFYPKRNTNYQSEHIKLKLSIPEREALYFEMQIRTHEMNEHAEHGPASHLIYKSRNLISFKNVPQLCVEFENGDFDFVNMDIAFKEFFGIELSDINPALSFDKLENFFEETNYQIPIGLLQIERDEEGNPIHYSETGNIVSIPINVMNESSKNNNNLEALALNIFTPHKKLEDIDDVVELS